MHLPEGQRSTAWVKRLPEVVAALSNEVTRPIRKKPAVAIKEKSVCKTFDSLSETCWGKGNKAPIPGKSTLPLPIR